MKQSISQSFNALIGPKAHTLILGTMPGQASLGARQYYAHPRNALWPIMHAIISASAPTYRVHQTLDYTQRCALLVSHGYALWDVLSSCERAGSLDSNIVRNSETPNDIATLVKQHPELSCIACNGRTAETLFKRHIKNTLPGNEKISASEDIAASHGQDQPMKIISLPSTSPAMATLNLDEKYQRWAAALAQH